MYTFESSHPYSLLCSRHFNLLLAVKSPNEAGKSYWVISLCHCPNPFSSWVIFYDQIDGVAMGSPLAIVLANLFMGHHEKHWLENYNLGIEFYHRYVDDTFALFNTKQDALSFFSYINIQHPNIKFTMEREENCKLPTRRPTLFFSLIFIVFYLFWGFKLGNQAK